MTPDETAAPAASRTTPAPPIPPRRSRRGAAALAALSFSTFCFVTVEMLPGGLITVIAPSLHTSVGRVGLLVSGYAAVVVLASVPLARATRRVPRRELLVGTLTLVVVANVMSAVATSYSWLFSARVLAALAHAMFWAVVYPAATALFDQSERGRVVARVSVGNALAPIVGLPLALFVGQHAGWRVSFAATGALCLAVAVAVAVLLPARPAYAEEAGRGTRPHRAAFLVLLAVTFLAVAGAISTFTYSTAYLVDVSGLDRAALSPVLVGVGIAGVVGMMLAGRTLDARPVVTQLAGLAVLTAALVVLSVGGASTVVAVAALVAAGLAFTVVNVAVQYLVLHFAPGSTDVASAAGSATFNLGTAVGTFAAGVLVDAAGAQALPGPAAAVVAAAGAGTVLMARLSRASASGR